MKLHEIAGDRLVDRLGALKRHGAMLGLLAVVAMMMGCYGYPRHWGDRDRDHDHDGDHDGDHHGQADSQRGRDSAQHVFYP